MDQCRFTIVKSARAILVFVYRVICYSKTLSKREFAQAEACGSEHKKGNCPSLVNRPQFATQLLKPR